MLTRWKAIFGSGPSLIVEPERSGSTVGLGERSSLRLALSFPKRNIYDYCHLISPFELNVDGKERLRWHVRDAMRQAILDKRSSDESIISFAELIVLCGFNGSTREWQRTVSPKEAIELAERYYKRTARWRKSVETGKSEEERINFSKDVYESENRIFSLFRGLRELYSKLLTTPTDFLASTSRLPAPLDESGELNGGAGGAVGGPAGEPAAESPGGGGAEPEASAAGATAEGAAGEAAPIESPADSADPEGAAAANDPREGHEPNAGESAAEEAQAPPSITQVYAHRVAVFAHHKTENAFEDAYITFKEALPKKKTRTKRVVREVASGGGGMNLETMLSLMQAMNLMQGGGKPQVLEEGAAAPAEQKKAPARKMRQTFGVKEKDRLIQLIYTCESNGVKFEKDYETLEAMVYRKPHQVVLTLATQIDDPVFYD